MKRLFDLVLCVFLIFLLSPLFLIVALSIRLTSPGPVVYWSNRVGKNSILFQMPKFRTMKIGTPIVATHLLVGADNYLTVIGPFLRKSSLDELPQLWSILLGDMSFVGPRPALYSQDDLIALRVEKGVDRLTPGLTGWAQVNGRDELSIPNKVCYEVDYLHRRSFWFDLNILWLTFLKVIQRSGISH